MTHELAPETETPVPTERPDADTYASDDPSPGADPVTDRPLTARELRRRHLAQVNRMARERDEALTALQETRADLERAVDERLRAYETARADESERAEFLRKKPDAQTDLEVLSGLRETFPGMSWDDAYVFHAARSAPEKLVDARRLRADRDAPRLDTSAYSPSRLRAEPDTGSMSAGEYRRYLDTLLASGKITL